MLSLQKSLKFNFKIIENKYDQITSLAYLFSITFLFLFINITNSVNKSTII